MSKGESLTIAAFTLFVVAMFFVFTAIKEKEDKEYIEACTTANGTPAHNGKFWECMK